MLEMCEMLNKIQNKDSHNKLQKAQTKLDAVEKSGGGGLS